VRGDALYARRVASNLAKLVEVVQVETLEERPAVRRDLALVKVMPKATELPEINALCGVFRAHIVDVSPESVIVEITGDETKIGRFCSMLRPYGVVELARSECVAMRRGESVHAAARTVSEREVLDRP
jgi:acetolactate synthase-1/3 small subunit